MQFIRPTATMLRVVWEGTRPVCEYVETLSSVCGHHVLCNWFFDGLSPSTFRPQAKSSVSSRFATQSPCRARPPLHCDIVRLYFSLMNACSILSESRVVSLEEIFASFPLRSLFSTFWYSTFVILLNFHGEDLGYKDVFWYVGYTQIILAFPMWC